MTDTRNLPQSGIRNRTIWTFWNQGFGNAPEVVKLCLQSWRRFNPGWEIRALDGPTLMDLADFEQIDIERNDITVQVISDLARISLLKRFGGVWADATVFCCKPLESWIWPYSKEGFFAFRNPGPDRLIASWFIAANPDNEILIRLHQEFFSLWTANRFSDPRTGFSKFTRRRLSEVLNKNPRMSTYWLSFIPRIVLRVYPYYVLHYTFNKLILSDESCRDAWQKSLPFEAEQPRLMTNLARTNAGLTVALNHIDNIESPVYKLNWRLNFNQPYWRGIFDRLLAKLGQT